MPPTPIPAATTAALANKTLRFPMRILLHARGSHRRGHRAGGGGGYVRAGDRDCAPGRIHLAATSRPGWSGDPQEEG